MMPATSPWSRLGWRIARASASFAFAPTSSPALRSASLSLESSLMRARSASTFACSSGVRAARRCYTRSMISFLVVASNTRVPSGPSADAVISWRCS